MTKKIAVFILAQLLIYKIFLMQKIVTFLFFIALSAQLTAQCDTSQNKITIFIKTDAFPKETGWLLSDKDVTQVYASNPPGTYQDAKTVYKKEVCVPKNKCLRFWLTDTNGKGFSEGGFSGYCVVKMNNDTIAKILYYEFSQFEYFNCEAGLTCSNPKIITEGTYTTAHKDVFYQFQPKKNGFYKISTCDVSNKCDTKIWLYEECRSFNAIATDVGYTKVADNSPTCDSLAVIDQVVLNKKQPYTIRIGGKNCDNKPIKWKLEFLGTVKGCRDSTACNYNYLAEEDGEPCMPQNVPSCHGPDLVIRGDSIARTLFLTTENADLNPCFVNEGCLNGFGKRDILRFSSWIANIGDQDYYIGKRNANPYQFVYDDCHQHYHYKGYAEYLLFDDKGNRLPVGFKSGFCVTDLICTDTTNMKYACEDMGISKTCSDVYDKTLDCQWVDITDVPAGKYTFVARVNWDNSPDKLGHMESRIDNNWAQVCLTIKRDAQNKITFTVDTSAACKIYKDCKGVPYGASVNDCEGNCAGTARQGDLNKDGKQDLSDTKQYLQESLNGLSATPCTDLNDDGQINVADASLLVSCLAAGKKHVHAGAGGTHDHCRFPQKVFKQQDTVFFSIQNYNPIGKYFDIAIRNPSIGVNAFQFNLTNVQISKVQSLIDTLKYPAQLRASLNKGIVMGISHQDSIIVRATTKKPLCRIFFNNQATVNVALDKIVAVTEVNGYNLVGKIEGSPIVISSDKEVPLMNLNPVVYPNPTNNNAILEFYNPENESFTLELYDVSGKILRQIKNIRENQVLIERKNLPTGFYVYQIKGEHGFASGKIIFE